MKRAAILLSTLLGTAAALAQTPAATGQVTKIDKPSARVTIKHGEIKHLDMPPMTMVYRVRDARTLESLAVGDKVRFSVEKADGQYTVTSIEKAP